MTAPWEKNPKIWEKYIPKNLQQASEKLTNEKRTKHTFQGIRETAHSKERNSTKTVSQKIEKIDVLL